MEPLDFRYTYRLIRTLMVDAEQEIKSFEADGWEKNLSHPEWDRYLNIKSIIDPIFILAFKKRKVESIT